MASYEREDIEEIEKGTVAGQNAEDKNDDIPTKRHTMILTNKYRLATTVKAHTDDALWETIALGFQTLGIVYGDIGTSPLYTVSSFSLPNPTVEDFLGMLSLILWTITISALIKYCFIVLRADDNGEGGTFALFSYICRHINFKSMLTIHNTSLASDHSMKYYTHGSAIKSRTKSFVEKSKSAQTTLTLVVLLGTCMVIGDGALTPATSVLSALGGIQNLSPKIKTDHVVCMAVGLLLVLFFLQRYGTSRVGFTFAPIMFIWFISIFSIGLYNIVSFYPSVLKGFSPHYIFKFFKKNGTEGWKQLGAVVLSITGAEAMFADLGHFNKKSIQLTFAGFIYPSLIISYAGEIAYLIEHPDDMGTIFYSCIPKPIYWPMFVIATMAAAIASQAMISACFSIVKQSLALGCFPRVTMKHTSSKHQGQVYSPEINFVLCIITLALIVGFKSSGPIGNAYGVAVIWVMMITTCLVSLLMLVAWDTKLPLILLFFFSIISFEATIMTALLNKIPNGGWAPFAISAVFMIIMFSWTTGRSRKNAYDVERMLDIDELNEMISTTTTTNSLHRPAGICLICSDIVDGIPPVIRHYIENTNSLREIAVFLTIRTLPIKTVLPEERLDVGNMGIPGVYRFSRSDAFGLWRQCSPSSPGTKSVTSEKFDGLNVDTPKTQGSSLVAATGIFQGPNVLYFRDQTYAQFGYKDEQSLEGNDVIASIVAKLCEIVESSEEGEKLEKAVKEGVLFVTGRTILKSKESNGIFDDVIINYLYRFLQKNSTSAISSLKIPPSKLLQVGMLYEI